ncbi:MAG: flagellar hook-length control protein FliK [Dongiaceae bacterium]
MSQALPVIPQLPVLDGHAPEPHRRPAESGDRTAHRHSFGKLLDRFAQRDAARDAAPEPQREPTADNSADSAAETDDTPRTAGDAQSADAQAGDTAVDDGPPATSDRTAQPDPEAAATAPAAAPAMPERSPISPAIVLPSPAPATASSQPTTGTAQPVTPPPASQIPQALTGEPASPESAGPAPLAVAVPETGTLRSPATPTLPDKGAGRPVAPSPEVTATAAPILPNASRKPAAGGEPTLAADAAEAVDAALPRPPAAATPSAETAGSDLQSRQDDTAKAGPVIALTAEQPASAARTAEHPFALTALDSPRGTAALYHKVAETTRGRTETPSPADQVSIRVLHAAAEGKRAIQMQLHPAELGTIDVKMQWQGDRLTAQFLVDRPETLQLFQRDLPALERTLNQAGVNVDSGSLSFSLRQQTGHGQGDNGRLFDPGAAAAAFADGDDLALGDEPLGQVIRDGVLSIRV